MKSHFIAPIAMAIALAGCQSSNISEPSTQITQEQTVTQANPFFGKFDTPYDMPPFAKIQKTHYLPAFYHGIEDNRKEIDAIANSTATPTFENTIEAMEKSGDFLNRVSNVFYGLTGSMSDEEMRAIAKEISPKLSALGDDIALNDALFQRVKQVYDRKDQLELRTDQMRLLEKTYKSFVKDFTKLSAKIKVRSTKLQIKYNTICNVTPVFESSERSKLL